MDMLHYASAFTNKGMQESETSVGYTNILWQFEIKQVFWDPLENIKVDESTGSKMLLREAREEFARTLMKIFASSLAIGDVGGLQSSQYCYFV